MTQNTASAAPSTMVDHAHADVGGRRGGVHDTSSHQNDINDKDTSEIDSRVTPGEVEIKRKRQAQLRDDIGPGAAAPEEQRLPDASYNGQSCRRSSSDRRRRRQNDAEEPSGDDCDVNEGSQEIPDRATATAQSKLTSDARPTSSRNQAKRVRSAASDALPNNKSRTGRSGKPKASAEQPEYWENYQGLYKARASGTRDVGEKVIALSYLALEDSAVELWPGGARARIFLDMRPLGPLAGVLYLLAGFGGIEDCTGAELLVFMVLSGKVTVKLSMAADNDSHAGASPAFGASPGSVIEVPPRSTYRLSSQSETGARLSFIVTEQLVAGGGGGGSDASRMHNPTGRSITMSTTQVA